MEDRGRGPNRRRWRKPSLAETGMEQTCVCPVFVLREWKAIIYFICLCKIAEILNKQVSQAGPANGKRNKSYHLRNLSLPSFPSTYLPSLSSTCPLSHRCAPNTPHHTSLPTSMPLLLLGPLPGKPSPFLPLQIPSTNKWILYRAWSDPPQGPTASSLCAHIIWWDTVPGLCALQ